MYEALYGALRKLPETGPNGFEGFVTAVLRDFVPGLAIAFLAKAGYQRGVDASSAGIGATWAALECKHYELGKCPPARELVGGLTLAINGARNQLDAWLLITTGAIGALDAAELKETADREAIALAIIDWQQAGLPSLGVLCAAVSDATVRELSNRLRRLSITRIQADLAEIGRHPAFYALREDLHHRLSAAEIGFDHARNVANTWVLESIGSSTNAWARLGQPLCPRDGGFSEWISRPRIKSALDVWYTGWSSNHAVGVLHGREGAGKSWIGLDWWSALSVKPLTLLITSNIDTSAEDAFDLLAHMLFRQTRMGDPQHWRRRLERWLRRPSGRDPAILVIVDGLNEKPREDWRGRFAAFRTEPLVAHLAVLVTVWTSYWENRVQPRLSEDLPVNPISVPIFDDAELREALRRVGQDFDSVSVRIREFVRVPRVLRVAVRYLDELRLGQLTVERLLLLDWRNRLRTEYGINHTEQEFRRIVVGLASSIRAGAPNFGIHHLRAHSSLAQARPNQDLDRDFEEIGESDLFEPNPGADGELRVKQEHTGLVLGMLLADEIRRAEAVHSADLDTRVEQALESASSFSEGSEVLRGAVAAACHWADYPDPALQALLRGWLRLRNRPEDHLADFEAYLPDRIDAYLGIADEVWVHFDRYHDGRDWMAAAIVTHLRRSKVFSSTCSHVNRWLGYWHEAWFPFLGRADQAWSATHGSEVQMNLNRASAAERELIREFLIEQTDEARPFAANFALLIASQGPRAPFVPGFLAWSLSRTIMKLPVDSDIVAWCLRLNRIDPAETERGILEATERLVAAGSIGRDAAILLLTALSTEACIERLSALRVAPTIRQAWQRAAPVLHPESEVSEPAAYLQRLSEIDPAEVWAHMDRTIVDHDIEDMEPAVAAFAPHSFAAFVRRVLRTAPHRDSLPLRQLAWNAPGHSLLIGPDETDALEDARTNLLPQLAENDVRETRFSESQLMLAVSTALAPEQRFERVAARPEAAHMPLSLARTFAPLAEEFSNRHLVSAVARNEVERLRAVLWFLASYRFDLTDDSRAALVQCFGHDDVVVRICAFQLASNCRDPSVLASLRSGTWRVSHEDRPSSEGFHGSKALILAAAPGDYARLRARVLPELWGFLAARDGSEAAIREFADDLDLLLRTLIAQDVTGPSLNSPIALNLDQLDDAEPRQIWADPGSLVGARSQHATSLAPESPAATRERLRQMLDPGAIDRRMHEASMELGRLFERARQIGATMFGHDFRPYGLVEAIRLRPELVGSWLSMLDGKGSETVVWRAGEFYRALALALASTNPQQAVGIIRRLRTDRRSTRTVYRPLKVDSLTYAFSKMPDCVETLQLQDEILDAAITDEKLFEIALAVQQFGGEDRLASVIERDCGSGVPALQARALTLVGWLDSGPTLDRLIPLLDRRLGYLAEVARVAHERLNRNRLARAWFGQFLSRRDAEAAWAAFRIALRSADRRFYIWSGPMMDSVAALPDRWRLSVAVAADHIRNSIERNEGKLEDTLFGRKIGSSQILAPWKRL